MSLDLRKEDMPQPIYPKISETNHSASNIGEDTDLNLTLVDQVDHRQKEEKDKKEDVINNCLIEKGNL